MRLSICSPFLGDYVVKVTASEIARKHNLNQKTVANVLDEFEEEGFLTSVTQGKNRIFALNAINPLTKAWIISLEHLRAIEFQKNHTALKYLFERFLPTCSGIVAVFGSYAKGTEKKESDLDMLIAGRCNHAMFVNSAQRIRIRPQMIIIPLEKVLKFRSDSDVLLQEIMNHHVLLLGAETFVNAAWKKVFGAKENIILSSQTRF